jgi:hypothetical protein
MKARVKLARECNACRLAFCPGDRDASPLIGDEFDLEIATSLFGGRWCGHNGYRHNSIGYVFKGVTYYDLFEEVKRDWVEI